MCWLCGCLLLVYDVARKFMVTVEIENTNKDYRLCFCDVWDADFKVLFLVTRTGTKRNIFIL